MGLEGAAEAVPVDLEEAAEALAAPEVASEVEAAPGQAAPDQVVSGQAVPEVAVQVAQQEALPGPGALQAGG